MANGLEHNEMPVEELHYATQQECGQVPSSARSGGLKYDADYHPIKTSKISDIVIKEIDYGYIVKIGCQTLAIESQTKLTRWLTEYIQDPQKITKRWNQGYYHFAKSEDIHIGVISYDKDDFVKWADHFPHKSKSRDNVKQFTIHLIDDKEECVNVIYHGVSSIKDCKGYSLHRILETSHARNNKDFEVILETIQATLYPQDND